MKTLFAIILSVSLITDDNDTTTVIKGDYIYKVVNGVPVDSVKIQFILQVIKKNPDQELRIKEYEELLKRIKK